MNKFKDTTRRSKWSLYTKEKMIARYWDFKIEEVIKFTDIIFEFY